MEVRPYDFEVIEKPANLDGVFSPLFNDNRKPKEPTFTREQLESIKQEAYQKGLKEGQAKGFEEGKNIADEKQQAVDLGLTNALSALTPKVDSFFNEYTQKKEEFKSEHAKLIIAIAQKITGKEAEEETIKNIEELILKCSDFIFNEPKITLTVNSEIIGAAKEKIDAIFKDKNYSGAMKILDSSEIALTDCKIEWEEGTIETSKQDIWGNIEALLEQNLQ